MRLLVVEDEALIALTLEDMLFNLGCTVVGVAGTAARAMALAADRSLPIDGAILDVNLGGETVYPAAQRLMCRGVPFVFCTGYGKAGIAAEFAHVPTLDKPYFEDQLRELIIAGLIAPIQHGLASGGLERPCPE
ncbi:MAG TPA: response regulator [Caulobacteraceae bacterium]